MSSKTNDFIGLLTYHSAYNYGSVLQAFATQQFIISNFPDTSFEIINYRMVEQRKFYALFRTKYGGRAILKDFSQLPIYYKRERRCNQFEDFINTRMKITKEYAEPEQVYQNWDKYSLVISGSDQIWNKHSCEMYLNEWKYIYPYVLHNFKGKKVSYASSFGNMSNEDIDYIIDDIAQFDFISMRELRSSEYLEKKLNRSIENVLDPTFLLTKEEWVDVLNLKKMDEKYIFYYSLGRNYLQSMRNLNIVIKFAKKKGYKLKVITPYMYLYENLHRNVYNCADMGPVEFLDCLYNAKIVITDSFHGTALSLNFNKDFYTFEITGGRDLRTTDLLKSVGLTDRLLSDPPNLIDKSFEDIDYKRINGIIGQKRIDSSNYLINAISSTLNRV